MKKLTDRESPSFEDELLSPRVRTRNKVRILRPRTKGARKFRQGIRTLILCGNDDNLKSALDVVREILHDLESSPSGVGLACSAEPFSKQLQESTMGSRQLNL